MFWKNLRITTSIHWYKIFPLGRYLYEKDGSYFYFKTVFPGEIEQTAISYHWPSVVIAACEWLTMITLNLTRSQSDFINLWCLDLSVLISKTASEFSALDRTFEMQPDWIDRPPSYFKQ